MFMDRVSAIKIYFYYYYYYYYYYHIYFSISFMFLVYFTDAYFLVGTGAIAHADATRVPDEDGK